MQIIETTSIEFYTYIEFSLLYFLICIHNRQTSLFSLVECFFLFLWFLLKFVVYAYMKLELIFRENTHKFSFYAQKKDAQYQRFKLFSSKMSILVRYFLIEHV